jgi:hypothetical protein
MSPESSTNVSNRSEPALNAPQDVKHLFALLARPVLELKVQHDLESVNAPLGQTLAISVRSGTHHNLTVISDTPSASAIAHRVIPDLRYSATNSALWRSSSLRPVIAYTLIR